jgi:serine/threonine protein kinase
MATLGKYDIVSSLGEGGFAKVKMAVNRETGERVALKISKQGLNTLNK